MGTLHSLAEEHFGLDKDIAGGVEAGFRCACRWRTPPNWSPRDWREEILATAVLSAIEAERQFDAVLGVPLAGYVCCCVRAQTLTRYRQEWRYALRHTVHDVDVIEVLPGAFATDGRPAGELEWLELALCHLDKSERWVVEQLFRQQRTESEAAIELGISQQAVNKRKRAAILHLRALL